MSAPRTKRQFAGAASDPSQRQITSFFSSSSSSPNSSSRSAQQEASLSSIPAPLLPASVQSNLLSVGMRVRKSVPEGYKTGSYSSFALWDDSCPVADDFAADIMPEGRSRANAFSTPRELLPFCGIHRTGGLDISPLMQPVISIDDDPDLNEIPGLSSSQDSMVSTDSHVPSPSRTRKRFFAEDEEDVSETPNRLTVWRGGMHDEAVSPRSLVPVGWGNGRTIAVPRKARQRGKIGQTTGQENLVVVDDDFEDADFLDANHSWEIEMRDA
jgi:hypothetical protein